MREVTYNIHENFEITKNVPGELSPILVHQVPVSKVIQLDKFNPFRFRIPALEKKTAVNLAVGDNIIDINHIPVKLEKLESCANVKIESNQKELKIIDIDTVSKKIKVNSPEVYSGVNLDVVYLPANGQYQIVYEPQGGQGTERKVFYHGSLGELNTKDQYKGYGISLPNKVIFDDWYLKIYVNTSANIDLNSHLAFLELPVIEFEKEEFMTLAATKGYTVEQLQNIQKLND